MKDLFMDLDKDTTEKIIKAIAPYIKASREPIRNAVVGRTGGDGAANDEIRLAMGLK